MKKIIVLKKWFLRKLNLLLGGVLSLLGFSSCGDVINGLDDPFNGVCLYGSPYAMYDVKGAVLNTEGKKLEGMKVTVKQVCQDDVWYMSCPLDTLRTDNKGEYESNKRWSGYNETMRIVVEDPNGVYAADSADVVLTRTDKDKGSWCHGTDEGTADFKLKKNDR
mgnify:CR=1 FL=1